jgi:small subunit ribosomal protein S2
MEPLKLEELLDSGVHFGHRQSRWNPKMEPYIFMKKNLIHIIDLRRTVRGVLVGSRFLRRVAAKGGEILFVGTKRQASNIVLAEAKRCGMHYVNTRWLGGTLTNFDVIRRRLRRLEELEDMEDNPRTKLLSKKIQASLARERSKMKRNLEGIRNMKKLPNTMVVVDPRYEHNAVDEARKMKIPVIAIMDTDADPEKVDIPIPANDDAMRSIGVLLTRLTGSVMEGVEVYKTTVGPVARDDAAARGGDRRGAARRPAEGRRRPSDAQPAPAQAPASPAAAPPPPAGSAPPAPAASPPAAEPAPAPTPPPAPEPAAEPAAPSAAEPASPEPAPEAAGEGATQPQATEVEEGERKGKEGSE